MNEESLEQIQFKISFLERANADLSDAVYRQQQDILALGVRLQEVAARLESALAEDRPASGEERPPHY
jgi:uncharacterized coiled-coil protein SlyX